MKHTIALVLLVGQAAYADTTTTTTVEKSTPVSCAEIEDRLVCSKTTVTAVTISVSTPLPKKRKEGKTS